MNGTRGRSVLKETLEPVESVMTWHGPERPQIDAPESVQKHYAELSVREHEVMMLVASGLLNKQIAWKLGISVPTVKFHRSAVMRKMGAGSLAELIWMAAALVASGEQLGIDAPASDRSRTAGESGYH